MDINKEEGIPGVELVLTRLHSGGKYGQGNYEYSGGTHGVGAKCVNAVSRVVQGRVTRDGKIHAMSFERGATKQPLRVIAEVKSRSTPARSSPFSRIRNFPGDDRIQERASHDAPE